MGRIEIFRGQARRRWSEEEKRQLVAETFMPGATVHAVAQRHGINTSQLFTWRKRYRGDLGLPAAPAAAAFAAVELVAARPPTETSEAEVHPHAHGVIEIDLPRRGRLRISGSIDPAVVTAALRVLVRR